MTKIATIALRNHQKDPMTNAIIIPTWDYRYYYHEQQYSSKSTILYVVETIERFGKNKNSNDDEMLDQNLNKSKSTKIQTIV